jgi:hypothetical protein
MSSSLAGAATSAPTRATRDSALALEGPEPLDVGERYDAFRFLDRTTALGPLPTAPVGTGEEETWPTGL